MVTEHEQMVARITETWERATPEQRTAGCRWYPMAGRIMADIGLATGYGPDVIAHVAAALSPRNPWLWNIADTYAFALAASTSSPRPSATTFERNRRTAWLMLTSRSERATLWSTAAPKVRAFVAAIMGDRTAVVVDTWAYRVATGREVTNGWGSNAEKYAAIVRAYTEVAKTYNVDPRDMQAVTWIVAQTEGLTSNRRGRHDLLPKRGTAAFVLALVSSVGA